jgi:plastocyanin domain-containing protein
MEAPAGDGAAAVTWDKIVVNLLGLALIAFIVWFFWLVKAKGVKAALTSTGYQEQMVLVKGGYTPDVIVVERGKPVRLSFVRQESASCSEMVLLPAFNKSAKLPEGETVAVEFLPTEAGEYEFACQMGMFRGTVIVEP